MHLACTDKCRSQAKGNQDEQLRKLPSLDLTPEQGMAAVNEETVVPQGPEHQHQEDSLPAGEASQAHIYFKDLKLLAHDNTEDTEEEDEEEEKGQKQQLRNEESTRYHHGDVSEDGSSTVATPTADSYTVRLTRMNLFYYINL